MTNAPHQRVAISWGSRIRAERLKRKQSQTELAALVDQTQTTVSRYERGEAPFTPEVLLTFAIALETTVPELFPWPVGVEDAEKFRRLTAPKPAVA